MQAPYSLARPLYVGCLSFNFRNLGFDKLRIALLCKNWKKLKIFWASTSLFARKYSSKIPYNLETLVYILKFRNMDILSKLLYII